MSVFATWRERSELTRHIRAIGALLAAVTAILLLLSPHHLKAPIVDSSFIPKPTGTMPASARVVAPERDASLPDSITVLLFAGTMPPAMTIEGGKLRIENDHGVRERIAIHAVGSRVAMDGGHCMERIRLSCGGAVTLTTDRRWRRIRGAITITAFDGRLAVTARMALRTYLTATLAAEASAADPEAYLIALAVVQRNYIVSHAGRHAPVADVCDNTHCQVTNLGSRPHAFMAAVDRSLRITVTAEGALPCYYCGACGGGTLLPSQIWRRSEPGYANVSCPNCRESRRFRWVHTIAATDQVTSLLGDAPRAPFVDDDFKIRVGRAIGFHAMPSNTVDRIERRSQSYVITGRGFGHRVGLCQAGAKTLARRGRSAADILRFYFPTAAVTEHSQPATIANNAAR